jgi:GNAT superfamily N-acetyltransferase
MINKIAPIDRPGFHELFAHLPCWHAFVDLVLDEGYGELIAAPRAAAIFLGGLVIYAGDPDDPAAAALIRHFPAQPAILDHNPHWTKKILAILGDGVEKSSRYLLPHTGLDSKAYRAFLRRPVWLPEPITAAAVAQLSERLDWEHQLHHYKNEADFLARGNGFVIWEDGRLLSGASSFAVSARWSECQVTTAPAARRRGMAQIVAAAYLDSCAQKGLRTPWDAANKASVRLGQSLGYGAVAEYAVFSYFR